MSAIYLRALFEEGGKRGAGDRRSLSRFPLRRDGDRISLRRLRRSSSLDRLPLCDRRWSDRLELESEDASDELLLSLSVSGCYQSGSRSVSVRFIVASSGSAEGGEGT